jgi:glucosylceramidase
VCVFVDPGHAFQTLLGIGGALTDAAAKIFAKLPEPQRQEFLRACYSPAAGIGYTLGRTSIHSSDFSSGSYAYVADKDEALKTFSVEHDERFRIPSSSRCRRRPAASWPCTRAPGARRAG